MSKWLTTNSMKKGSKWWGSAMTATKIACSDSCKAMISNGRNISKRSGKRIVTPPNLVFMPFPRCGWSIKRESCGTSTLEAASKTRWRSFWPNSRHYGLAKPPHLARWQAAGDSMERMEGYWLGRQCRFLQPLLRSMVRHRKTQTCRGAHRVLVVEPGGLTVIAELRAF